MDAVRFRPRRLGHVNFYVTDLKRSIAFYEQVCGLERVRMEAAINAGFLSNGNTHHDVGLIEVSRGADRVGRDGQVQIRSTRGTRPGLNHLGWEMESQAELVAAYARMLEAGLVPTALFDHIISHAVYVADPDGNVHEFYADAMKDWRSVFNLSHDDLVTSQWDPLAAAPSHARNYVEDPEIRRLPGSALQASHLAGAVLRTHDIDAMRGFFETVAGLDVVSEDRAAGCIVFAGRCGRPELTLLRASAGEAAGFAKASLLLQEPVDMPAAMAVLDRIGVHPVAAGGADGGASLLLADPDGVAIELRSPVAVPSIHPGPASSATGLVH